MRMSGRDAEKKNRFGQAESGAVSRERHESRVGEHAIHRTADDVREGVARRIVSERSDETPAPTMPNERCVHHPSPSIRAMECE